MKADLSRILIIKPSSLGDVVQAVPVAWALRELAPQARIDWLVIPAFAGLVEGLGAINEVILFDRRRYGQMWRSPAALGDFVRFVRDLRRRRYTVTVDLQGLFRSGFLSYASGAPRRVGLAEAREGATHFYTDRVPTPTSTISTIDRYLQAAVALGAPADPPRRFDLHVPPQKVAEARTVLAAQGLGPDQQYVVLVPGARWMTKVWPRERFAELARLVHDELKLMPVLLGAAGDRPMVAEIARLRGRRIVDLAGRTDMKTMAAVLLGARCVVAGDTGPMHLAGALGRPVVALFMPTDRRASAPSGSGHLIPGEPAPCAPCLRVTCPKRGQPDELICQKLLTVPQVFAAVKQLLGRCPS